MSLQQFHQSNTFYAFLKRDNSVHFNIQQMLFQTNYLSQCCKLSKIFKTLDYIDEEGA